MGLCVLRRALRVLEEVPASRSTKEEKELGVGGSGWGGGSSSETMETKLGHCTNFVLPLRLLLIWLRQGFVCVWLAFPLQRC